MDLSGKTALVTGAARGIGRAIALRLAQAGADVALVDLDADMCGPAAESIRELGRRAVALGADVADFAQASAAAERALAELGRLDILVNNAGITRDGLFLRMAEQDFDRVVAVNLKGCFNFCRALARSMTKARSGRIINVASVIGITGNAGQANYAAAKAGLLGLTKSLAKEFGARNITVNAVAPGFIMTDMTEALPDEVKEESRKAIPLGRFGTPEDVAGAVLFLASDLGAYVTGHVLLADGGMAM
ncbi:MAG: 3-oxoacyl-[acyl-carrier-protein] reductase [Planctomycetes bacterium]|nr:3-oxoacyl-[acyl-carrier-protein] reductase [Planctomycetota bacterium]